MRKKSKDISRSLFAKSTKEKRACLLYKNVNWFKFKAGTNLIFPCYKNRPSLRIIPLNEINLRDWRESEKGTKYVLFSENF